MRETGFQRSGQALGKAGAIIDQTTALRDQEWQGARRGISGRPGRAAVALMVPSLGGIFGIGGIILSAAR